MIRRPSGSLAPVSRRNMTNSPLVGGGMRLGRVRLARNPVIHSVQVTFIAFD